MNFAIANPARQVFFTVVEREEKYKAKNLIDVVIYRGSDALYGWVFDSLQALGLKLGAIALVRLPVAAGWLVLSARWAERRNVAPHRRAGAGRTGAGRTGMMRMTRREFAALGTAALVARPASAQNNAAPLHHPRHPAHGRAHSGRRPWHRLCV